MNLLTLPFRMLGQVVGVPLKIVGIAVDAFMDGMDLTVLNEPPKSQLKVELWSTIDGRWQIGLVTNGEPRNIGQPYLTRREAEPVYRHLREAVEQLP